VGEVDRPGVNAECAAGGGVWRHTAALAVVTYPGWRNPDVHVSLITGGGQGLSHLVLEKQTKCIPIRMPGSSFIHIVDISE
jgi:hypothetical protein